MIFLLAQQVHPQVLVNPSHVLKKQVWFALPSETGWMTGSTSFPLEIKMGMSNPIYVKAQNNAGICVSKMLYILCFPHPLGQNKNMHSFCNKSLHHWSNVWQSLMPQSDHMSWSLAKIDGVIHTNTELVFPIHSAAFIWTITWFPGMLWFSPSSRLCGGSVVYCQQHWVNNKHCTKSIIIVL